LLIDSEQLESGEALDKNFRDMAADEIERFRREIVARTGNIRAGERTPPGPIRPGNGALKRQKPREGSCMPPPINGGKGPQVDVPELVFYRGQVVGETRRFSDTLAMFNSEIEAPGGVGRAASRSTSSTTGPNSAKPSASARRWSCSTWQRK
jgi:hypothetical protein